MDSMKAPGKLQELSLEFTRTPDGVHKDAWLSVTISTFIQSTVAFVVILIL